MSINFRSFFLSKNVITYLYNVFIQSQIKQEMFKALQKYHQNLLKENMKAAQDKSQFFLTRVNFLEYMIEVSTIAL